MNNYGEKLRCLRKEQKLSRERLAKAAGLARTSIENWENEAFSPTLENYQKALNALGYELRVVKKDE